MSDAAGVANAYVETWNATEPDRLRALLASHWCGDATYADPLMRGAGADQIAALVQAVHERFPGYRFRLAGTPNGHAEFVRLAWTLGPDDADHPIAGSDVVQLAGPRIERVIGFIDRAPGMA